MCLCCVLLFPVFSTIANADEIEIPAYEIYQFNSIKKHQGSEITQTEVIYYNGFPFTPNDGTAQTYEHRYNSNSTSAYNLQANWYYHVNYDIYSRDNATLFEAGKSYSVSLNNFYYSLLVEASEMFYITKPSYYSVNILYADGTIKRIWDINSYSPGDKTMNLSFDLSPDQDVKRIYIEAWTDISSKMPEYTENYSVYLTSYFGEYQGDDRFQYSIEVESQEAGLLKEGNSLLSGIKNGIGNLFSAITDLPAKIWGFFEDGLKALFVPNQVDMEIYKDSWQILLEDRFGAVYQVSEMLVDSWDGIKEADETNTIYFPETTISLPDDVSFTFGGYDVQIVPNGFEFFVEFVKLAVGMVCTYLFVNGLLKRYEEIMGVEK